ncbi:MAG: hypothetical protein U0228_21930 [Myxococcaceae bacterium]
MRSTCAALAAALLSLTGCHHHHREPRVVVAVPVGQPGTPRQPTQTAYSEFGGQRESTPYGVGHEVILDEATLYPQPNQTCVNVVLRQPMGLDEPVSQLNIRCSADSRYKERASVTQEVPAVERDYPFAGAAPVLRIRGPHGGLDLPLGAAVPNQFRVVERAFQLCCPFPATRVFRLTIDGQDRYNEYARTDFAWRLD